METLKLNDVERLILANQYQILEKLEPNNEYGLLAEHLKNGYSFFYEDRILNNLNSVMSKEDQHFVIDVLNMFELLHDSYVMLEDKTGIDESYLKFGGFDYNNLYEIRLSGFVTALYAANKFTKVIPRGAFNSHSERVGRYTRYLNKFNKIGGNFPFSKDEILQVISFDNC